MKTWRERIAEARARKALGERGFTSRDRGDAEEYCTCKVGEEVNKSGGLLTRFHFVGPSGRLHGPDALGMQFFRAVKDDDITRAEEIADAIEDRALELKRTASPARERVTESDEVPPPPLTHERA